MELLSPPEMAEADRLTVADGILTGIELMRRAGAAVAAVALGRFPASNPVHVLAGPGNNGGDGYVAATLLAGAGRDVRLWRTGEPGAGTDAWQAARECPIEPRNIAGFSPEPGSLVIDALFGAGLSKPVDGAAANAIERTAASGAKVLAIDLPSGVPGDGGRPLGAAVRADLTVTFFRRKPGHLLLPGRELCGETIVADIGIRPDVLDRIRPSTFVNLPALWQARYPHPHVDTHKYARGHVGVFSGGPASTGAARLSAMAAARAGAGAVTLLSQASALQVNAAHLTSIILRRTESLEDVEAFLAERRPAALVFGPGLGLADKVAAFGLDLIAAATDRVHALVLDADGLTALAKRRDAYFAAGRREGAPHLLLTPHEGEFRRMFPDLSEDGALSKLDRARRAAERSAATVILKGPDTVIASPDGRAAINANGSPWLATAGSGDVLSGIAAGLLAQGMPAFEAACAAVWMHAEAGTRFGPGLIAEDLPLALLPVLRDLAGDPPGTAA